jgi:hypothetical protein
MGKRVHIVKLNKPGPGGIPVFSRNDKKYPGGGASKWRISPPGAGIVRE